MNRSFSSTTRAARRGPYVVRAPREEDVMTGSLKAAFGKDKSVPDDMAQLLMMLNRVPD